MQNTKFARFMTQALIVFSLRHLFITRYEGRKKWENTCENTASDLHSFKSTRTMYIEKNSNSIWLHAHICPHTLSEIDILSLVLSWLQHYIRDTTALYNGISHSVFSLLLPLFPYNSFILVPFCSHMMSFYGIYICQEIGSFFPQCCCRTCALLSIQAYASAQYAL